MNFKDINSKGVVLLGCGKMGSALLAGWLDQGISHDAISVFDPAPSDWVKSLTVHGTDVNGNLPQEPAVCLLAVKPQIMKEALPSLKALDHKRTVYISIAAGTSIEALEGLLGPTASVIRAMPNTPVSVGKGITAFIGNEMVTESQLVMTEKLFQSVGKTVRLEHESQMDIVTAISGSGPAYVFYFIEALAAAGKAQGLSEKLSLTLAKATVSGASHLAEASTESPSQLRINVTSPKGTTAAALDILMNSSKGFDGLLLNAVKAATDRSRELSV